ncbi:hypothetical protein D9758_012990 [Tetrapyrgos nigripes]|uniref:Uncharacterized protein n=1 Tax=Tetrapyrgos nigripes TaxID=182062 RepID=A0A8H5CMV7_9AGAR|nr:hypothetical protein D9758_012990 [Tetrapyrgos nigripes]
MLIAELDTLYNNFPTAVLYLQEMLHDWESTPKSWKVQLVWDHLHQRIVSQCAHYTTILPAGINSYLSIWVHDNHQSYNSCSSNSHTSSLSFCGAHSNPAAAAIAGAVKPKTHCQQQLTITEFAVWANDMGLHPDEVLPAPEAVLCEFAASFLGRLAGGTVKAKLSALKTWHTTLGFRWQGADLLCKTLTGVNRQSPSSSHHPECPPIT